MEAKTNIKTINKLNEIPVVNSAVKNASGYYESIKQKNILTRTSCNLAEIYLRTVAYAATPITSICKKPCNLNQMNKENSLFVEFICLFVLPSGFC